MDKDKNMQCPDLTSPAESTEPIAGESTDGCTRFGKPRPWTGGVGTRKPLFRAAAKGQVMNLATVVAFKKWH